ncbi:hypothetical protein VTI74DRAFT_7031 [Chaetomium olivicolor]
MSGLAHSVLPRSHGDTSSKTLNTVCYYNIPRWQLIPHIFGLGHDRVQRLLLIGNGSHTPALTGGDKSETAVDLRRHALARELVRCKGAMATPATFSPAGWQGLCCVLWQLGGCSRSLFPSRCLASTNPSYFSSGVRSTLLGRAGGRATGVHEEW